MEQKIIKADVAVEAVHNGITTGSPEVTLQTLWVPVKLILDAVSFIFFFKPKWRFTIHSFTEKLDSFIEGSQKGGQ